MDNYVEQLHSIPVDRDLMELTRRGTPDFPAAVYDNTFSEFLTGRVPWHWHGEIEIIRLLSGAILLRCGEQSATLEAGSGAFINANTLHAMSCVDPAVPCRMISIAFSPSLIAGLPQGLCARKFIEPLAQCRELPFVPLYPGVLWQAEVLEALQTAFTAYKERAFACEMVVVEQLTGIFRRIAAQNQALLHGSKANAGDARIKEMLAFMQQNYASRLTLREIAGAAHVSERACTRCFREKLHTTPFACLHALRVRAAAQMLRDGDETVGEIAAAVGFAGDSYFSRVFRGAVGCSPREYRKKYREG